MTPHLREYSFIKEQRLEKKETAQINRRRELLATILDNLGTDETEKEELISSLSVNTGEKNKEAVRGKKQLIEDVDWLLKNGYLEEDQHGLVRMSQKGFDVVRGEEVKEAA